MKRILSVFLVLSVLVAGFSMFSSVVSAEEYATQMPEIKEHGFITARDGAKIEYGVYGDSNKDVLIMLPCNGGDMHNFDGNLLPEFAEHFKVITVSPRGTGQSERGEGELTFDVEADDLLWLLDELEIDKAHFYGFSDGGNIALQLEVMYPGTLGAISTGGANIFVEGSLIPSFAEEFLAEPNPNPLTRMMQIEPAMTPQDMQTIAAPALIMAGEHDLILEDHTRLIASNIPGAELKIIPGEDHGSYICNSPKLAPLMLEFFKEIGY